MNLLIVRNNSNSQAIDASLLLATYLGTQGIGYAIFDPSDLEGLDPNPLVSQQLARGVDLAVVLGGDGTILRTARAIGTSGVPILGINFGRLGFLANESDDGVVAIVAAALAGETVSERRSNLRVDIVCEGEVDPWASSDADELFGISPHEKVSAWFDEEEDAGVGPSAEDAPGHTFFALNEAAVTRGANGRIIDFSLSISDVPIADMRGDGLVVATATGSTAYALSVGGPLVAPGFNGLIAVPIAPHSLRARAMLTSENDVVEMDLSQNAAGREATLFIDGDMAKLPSPIKHMYVRRGAEPTTLLRYKGENFYEYASSAFF